MSIELVFAHALHVRSMQPSLRIPFSIGCNLALPCFIGLNRRHFIRMMVRILRMHCITEIAVLSSLLKRCVQKVMTQKTVPTPRKPQICGQSGVIAAQIVDERPDFWPEHGPTRNFLVSAPVNRQRISVKIVQALICL